MTDTVTIPRAEYRRLCAAEEDLSDIHAALAVQARIDAGTEEFVPERVASRLMDGEPPLRVWREYRGLTQAALSRAAGVSRVQIVEIEAGRRTGSVLTLRRLADALRVDLDDIVPG
ncbi:MAG: helix-turn-helix transcriptional regulator [Acidobacteria bacterium]|nr:helix-turn-helix transcriptional regulator [Acidobacteriota bacterium]